MVAWSVAPQADRLMRYYESPSAIGKSSREQFDRHKGNTGLRSQTEHEREPAERGAVAIDRVHGSPCASSDAALFQQAARVSGAPKVRYVSSTALSPPSTGASASSRVLAFLCLYL